MTHRCSDHKNLTQVSSLLDKCNQTGQVTSCKPNPKKLFSICISMGAMLCAGNPSRSLWRLKQIGLIIGSGPVTVCCVGTLSNDHAGSSSADKTILLSGIESFFVNNLSWSHIFASQVKHKYDTAIENIQIYIMFCSAGSRWMGSPAKVFGDSKKSLSSISNADRT